MMIFPLKRYILNEKIYRNRETRDSNKILKKTGLDFIEIFDLDRIKHIWYKIERTEYKNKKPK